METFTIKTTQGIHAAIAAKMVQAASRYNADIKLIYQNKIVDVKSILGLMSLAVPEGENVILQAEGVDATAAILFIIQILD